MRWCRALVSFSSFLCKLDSEATLQARTTRVLAGSATLSLAPPSLIRCVTREARAMIKRLDEVEERGCRKRNAQRQQQQPPFRVLLDGL